MSKCCIAGRLYFTAGRVECSKPFAPAALRTVILNWLCHSASVRTEEEAKCGNAKCGEGNGSDGDDDCDLDGLFHGVLVLSRGRVLLGSGGAQVSRRLATMREVMRNASVQPMMTSQATRVGGALSAVVAYQSVYDAMSGRKYSSCPCNSGLRMRR